MPFNKIKTYIKQNIDPYLPIPIFNNKNVKIPKIIIGLSGGPDSLFLFYFLKHLEQENFIILIAAHLNHGWRTESSHDAQFCKKLCNNHNVPIIITHAKNLKEKPKFNGSKEEIGRKLRQAFFTKTLKEQNADYVALAHHQQDQQETFFLRLIRGCSLSGLTSIKPVNNFYIHPLLSTSKKTILNYLQKNNITFFTDPTNESDLYLRNRIRKYIIPALKKCDLRFNKKFETSLNQLQKEELFLQTITNQTFENIFNSSLNEQLIGKRKNFIELDSILQKRILILWHKKEFVPFTPSTSYLNEIIRFLSSSNGGIHQINVKWAIKKKNNLFWIVKNRL